MEYLIKAWEGKEIPQIGAVEVMILTVGQVILIFMVILAFSSCSMVVFCGELVHKQLKDMKQDGNNLKAKMQRMQTQAMW